MSGERERAATSTILTTSRDRAGPSFT
jgi:hypothetical protein